MRCRATSAVRSMSVEADAPAVGSISRSSSRPSVDLPQPDSPTSASVSPRIDLEATLIDGAHLGRGCSANCRPPPSAKRAAEALGRDDRRSRRGHCAASARRTQHAAFVRWRRARTSAASRSAHVSMRAAGSADGSGQPAVTVAGRRARCPGSGYSRRAVVVRAAGSIAAGRACRDARRRGRSSRTSPVSTTLAGIHHDDALGDLGDDAEIVGDEQDRGVERLARSRASAPAPAPGW